MSGQNPSSRSYLLSFEIVAAQTVDMPLPGSTYFLPLDCTVQNHSLPSALPLLVYPHRTFLARGIMATPFLLDGADLSSVALVCMVHTPLVVTEGEVVATAIPVALEINPESYMELQPINGSNPSDVLAIDKEVGLDRPSATFNIQGRPLSGILDTGADVSVIRQQDWPSSWPTTSAPAVRGVGGIQDAKVSKHWLPVTSSESALVAHIKPVILPLHVNLWGRDLLSQFDARLVLT